jgi:hypothetical protein
MGGGGMEEMKSREHDRCTSYTYAKLNNETSKMG